MNKKLSTHDEIVLLEFVLECIRVVLVLLPFVDLNNKMMSFEAHLNLNHIFIDEASTDKCAALRKFGYSFVGICAVMDRLLIQGKRFLTTAAMCIDGMIDWYITSGSVVRAFIECCLLPHLFPYNGTNPRTVVQLVMCSLWCT
jgi:hypothetical protein